MTRENPSNPKRLRAAIELGGTKILCRVVDATGRRVAEARFATTTPERAIDDLAGCIAPAVHAGGPLEAIGVASFGPIGVDRHSPDYGRLLATPKAGWSRFDLLAALTARFGAPVEIDTDVNAAALAEQAKGAGRGFHSVGYVTVGTGIGGGLAVGGVTLRGALHPEIGHVRVRRRPGDGEPSACPFHEDCVEGLAAGPAIAHRLGAGRVLADDAHALELVAAYIGDLAATLVLAWAPERLIFGGGVMTTVGLNDKVAESMRLMLGNYGPSAAAAPGYLVPAELVDPGLEGALMLAGVAAAGNRS